MTEAERYLLLGLRLGRHVDGLVDSYYGPPELQQRAGAGEPVPAEQLARDADALLADVDDGWLGDQVAGLATYAHVVAGEPISYADEVAACYGVRPTRWDEHAYAAAHAQLEELLPGEGSLVDRREAWREANLVPDGMVVPLFRAVAADLRERTAALLGLPAGEELTIEEVRDEPWWAFNYYLGDLRSRVVVNADVPTTLDDIFELAAHEAYPGHHTEGSTKERLLVREQGLVEQTIHLVPTPQSLIAEGIAETARDVLGEDAQAGVVAILHEHGMEYDAERARAIRTAFAPLRRVGLDAALLLHEDGASVDEALEHMMRFGVMSRPRAEQIVRFVTDPTWRAYVLTYSAGGDLARAFHGDDAARFGRLLGEQIRVDELVAAAA